MISQHLRIRDLILTLLKLKAEYNLVKLIKGASGFHYDDEKGAIVDKHTGSAWDDFCKVSRVPEIKPFSLLFFFSVISRCCEVQE